MSRRTFLGISAALGLTALTGISLGGCDRAGHAGAGKGEKGKLAILAAENTYGDVARQIGGSFADVTSVISDPGADPHNFEITPSDAKIISQALIVVENGLSYDDWMDKMLASSERVDRTIISAQKVLKLPDDTQNPHLWYDPATMPQVAKTMAAALKKHDPDHASEYDKNLKTFSSSVERYRSALADLGSQYPAASAAATEPVANYMLAAAGVTIKTPWSLQAAIMNDQDPSAQDIGSQMKLLSDRQVDFFVYNEQVTSSLTKKFLDAAKEGGVPVVAVYETMPEHHDYASWMLAEVDAIKAALSKHESTTSLS
ncbi:metal ABC transporter solute-binding protein, Zn/Mn family [Coriobacterium glomerans]|uniref:metal ABC transporter solute-binding protein, Zn/Mn family n=1 Tax=Coriobacterium glomerans TaxID=33871 RepID=UPI00155A2617|nr:zinc ABC transporter substrate-binding protein [Coriobacterium glomerans]